MEVDKKMGIDVYEQIPVMKSEKFLLREIEDGDAEDLLKVYSDKDAVPLFNSDNCVNGFYYTQPGVYEHHFKNQHIGTPQRIRSHSQCKGLWERNLFTGPI